MITDNSPELGTFGVTDHDGDKLSLSRYPMDGGVEILVTEHGTACALLKVDEIPDLVRFLTHGLSPQQKTQLAMSLLEGVSFKSVLDFFGMEAPK